MTVFLAKRSGGWRNAGRSRPALSLGGHGSGGEGIVGGISAFPSMHVSLVTLNALFLFEFSRRGGLALFAYVALVVASSVYLAWHYAIDGCGGRPHRRNLRSRAV